MMTRLAFAALVLAPTAVLAERAPLSCRIEQTCVRGAACTATDTDFRLEPTETGYAASLDAGRVETMQVSPPEADVLSFLLSNEESVTVLLSIFPDGAFALTAHEDIDGPYVETAVGRCVEDK